MKVWNPSSDYQRPTSLISSIGTLPWSKAVAPVHRIAPAVVATVRPRREAAIQSCWVKYRSAIRLGVPDVS
jgi:hypothetical protein